MPPVMVKAEPRRVPIADTGTPARRHLRLVASQNTEDTSPELETIVRSSRRDLARLLRALRALGKSPTAFPPEVLTRLAHCDSLTTSYLLDPAAATEGQEAEVLRAAHLMRDIEFWLVEALPSAEIHQLRLRELQICIDEQELRAPLVASDWNEAFAAVAPPQQSGVFGQDPELFEPLIDELLRDLSDHRLDVIALRLGVSCGGRLTSALRRKNLEQQVAQTLLDPQLLAVLVATLAPEAQRILVGLAGHNFDELSMQNLVAAVSESALRSQEAVVGSPVESPRASGLQVIDHPVLQLRDCGLVHLDKKGQVAIPQVMQRRVEGLLQSFGLT